MKFKDYVFGDLSGLREYRRGPEAFIKSFVPPDSFSLASLRNDMNHIIVGRKGAGKSTCCLVRAHEMQEQGYHADFYNFSEDLSRSDFQGAVRTQRIDLKEIDSKRLFDSITEFYDFRDFWKRRVLYSISQAISDGSSHFVRFLKNCPLKDGSIAGGVTRGLKIPGFEFPIGIPSEFKMQGELTLSEYVDTATKLLVAFHPGHRHVFFFDELNVSHVKSKSDEFNTLIALVRDIIRASTELNDVFADNGLDIHVICALRPEIREELKRRDVEIGKILDSNYVSLSWPTASNSQNALIGLLKLKIENARLVDRTSPEMDVSSCIPTTIHNFDEGIDIPFPSYFLNLTWYRPRDIIRLLKSYQATNGSQSVLFSRNGNQVEFLKDYGRASSSDCLAEMETKYSREFIDEAMRRIQSPVYQDADELLGALSVLKNRVDLSEFISDLFDAGFIFNHQKDGEVTEIFASYRGDTHIHLKKRIFVHRGLQSDPRLGFSRRIWVD
jgi:hypothetical protein